MKHCISYNLTKLDSKLFKINIDEFNNFKDFLKHNSIRSIIDAGSAEYQLMSLPFEQCDETDKAWYKLLLLLFGFGSGFDVKAEVNNNITRMLKRCHNYETTVKRVLAGYIILLRTGCFSTYDYVHDELTNNLSTDALVDLLKEELEQRVTIYTHKNPENRFVIVEIADYYWDYMDLYSEFNTNQEDAYSEAYKKYIEYVTTAKHTSKLINHQIMLSQMYGE